MSKSVEEIIKKIENKYRDVIRVVDCGKYYLVIPAMSLRDHEYLEICELLEKDGYQTYVEQYECWRVEKRDSFWIDQETFAIKKKLIEYDLEFEEGAEKCLEQVDEDGIYAYFRVSWKRIKKSKWSIDAVLKFVEKYAPDPPLALRIWLERVKKLEEEKKKAKKAKTA